MEQRSPWQKAASAAVDLGLREAAAGGTTLDAGQTSMVRTLATDRRQLQLVIALASAGKTTALRVLAYTWTGGGGHILGLAPSATAAAQLAEATGIPRGHPARPSIQLWWETSSPSAWSSWAGIMRVGDLMRLEGSPEMLSLTGPG